MSSLSNDVKSIIFKYMYDQVVGQISVDIPLYDNGLCDDIIKSSGSWVRSIGVKIHSIHCQDFNGFAYKYSRTFAKISIINGNIYFFSQLNRKYKLIPFNHPDDVSCWENILNNKYLNDRF